MPTRHPFALLAVSLLGSTLLPSSRALSQASQSEGCLLCPWLDDLPLREWSAQRNHTVLEQLPWGEQYTFAPLDYEAIAHDLCDCVHSAAEGWKEPQHGEGFVEAAGSQFLLDGQPFYFTGFNAQQALAWAASNQTKLLDDLELLFASAQGLSLQVGRVWAHADGWDVLPPSLRRWDEWPRVVLQQEPGSYNETAWQGLDFVLHTAAQHGIKLILTLSDYHSQFGEGQSGIEPYLQWVLGSFNISGTTVLDFYTDERAKLLFKANMCRMATRVSSITGRAYRDDPAVFGWELINEPRCPACPGSTQSEVLVSWAAEMSDFMKCVDPTHLVSVGLEGYFGETDSDELLKANPGAWVLCEGASWSQLAALPHIDFNTAHMYQTMRGSWDEATKTTCGFECAMRWFGPWIESHVNASTKPFVLEEFQQPFTESEKNAVFDLVRSTVQGVRARHAASSAAGTMFWGATVGEHVDWDGNGLYLDGSLPLPAPDDDVARARLSMPEAEKNWLAAVQDMQKSFRRQEAVSACYEDMKKRYAYLYSVLDGRARIYNCTSTLRIVKGMAADAEQVDNPLKVQPDGGAQG